MVEWGQGDGWVGGGVPLILTYFVYSAEWVPVCILLVFAKAACLLYYHIMLGGFPFSILLHFVRVPYLLYEHY